jgi:diaminopimelate decarboxylase
LNLPRLKALEKIERDGIEMHDMSQVDDLLKFCELAYGSKDLAVEAVQRARRAMIERMK